MFDPATVSYLLFALLIGHFLGDIIVQTDHQAAHKNLPGARGRRACLAHVIGYGITQTIVVVALVAVADIEVHPLALTAGLTLSIATHYPLDRGPVLAWLAGITRSPKFWETQMGRLLIDQVSHLVMIAVAAIVINL